MSVSCATLFQCVMPNTEEPWYGGKVIYKPNKVISKFITYDNAKETRALIHQNLEDKIKEITSGASISEMCYFTNLEVDDSFCTITKYANCEFEKDGHRNIMHFRDQHMYAVIPDLLGRYRYLHTFRDFTQPATSEDGYRQQIEQEKGNTTLSIHLQGPHIINAPYDILPEGNKNELQESLN